MRPAHVCFFMAVLSAWAAAASGQSSLAGETLHISRATGPIKIDGELSDEAWRSATRVEKWYEVQPGDNNEPPVRNVGFLTFDDRVFYVGFEFDDPTRRDPRAVRRPRQHQRQQHRLRRHLSRPLNSGRTAIEFFVTPRNVQYDAVTDDASGENSSPDFFWDSAAKITDHGWTLEIRIPFSSLRYRNARSADVGHHPVPQLSAAFRYQFFSTAAAQQQLPRLPGEPLVASSICLPAATSSPHRTSAPTDTARVRATRGPASRSPRPGRRPHRPRRQVPTPTPTRDRFHGQARFLADRVRHGADLGQRALRAVLSREAAVLSRGGRPVSDAVSGGLHPHRSPSPSGAAAITGKEGRHSLHRARHRGRRRRQRHPAGANSSSSANQDFASTVFVGRAKREIGLSFVGAMITDRGIAATARAQPRRRPRFPVAALGERRRHRPVAVQRHADAEPSGSRRRVERSDADGQRVPDLLDSQHAGISTGMASYADVGSGFRADTGFIPQVGYREVSAQTGWQVYPTG